MEPAKGKIMLALGKFQVTKVDPGTVGARITIQLPQGVSVVIDSPVAVDVRVGDLLTLYTEVFSAQPDSTPEQRVH